MDSAELARRIRLNAILMVHRANSSHIGGCLSMADLLAVLYRDVMRFRTEEPDWRERDRFILSKGHCTAVLYALLAELGFFPLEELQQYGQDGSRLLTHVSHKVPGVDFSTGSLGHGLPFGCGKALAAKRQKQDWQTYVMLSDGELDEGSNWEAILFAGHHRLGNLTAIVDYNKIQSLGDVKDVLDLHPLADKFRACHWDTLEIDGHDHAAIKSCLRTNRELDKPPRVIIAHTIKGKGVDFMENNLQYHYSPPRSEEQMRRVLQQLGQAPR
jgi:transketolase